MRNKKNGDGASKFAKAPQKKKTEWVRGSCHDNAALEKLQEGTETLHILKGLRYL